MQRMTKVVVGIILLSVPFVLSAKSIPKSFPQDLIYKRKIIDPLCFFEIANKLATVQLNSCGLKAVPNRRISGNDDNLVKAGFNGYEYTWASGANKEAAANGYSFYKVLGSSYGSQLIYTLNNSGGSGQFSSLALVKREDDTLKIKTITSGDRCNGGITNAEQQGEKLTYTINVTPSDFFDLVKEKPANFNPYTDLAFCAICCVATATFTVNPAHDSGEPQLLSVKFNEKANEAIVHEGSYQGCFNHVVTAYQKQGQTSLSPQALHDFLQQFQDICLKK